MSKVLFNRAPIVIDIELATRVGLHEAIILQQMHYWLELNKEKERNYIEDKYWTYNPISEWQKKFPFLSDHAVRKGLEHLRKEKLLLTGNFNKSRVDRTLWYTIDYKNLEKLMQVVVVQSINESENGEHATNAFDENNKCKDKKATNAFDESNTPIPENNTSMYLGMYLGMYEDAIDCYEKNFCQLVPSIVLQTMISFMKDGISQELICHVICKSVEDKKTWTYAKGTLNKCVSSKCYTVQQFEIKNKEFRNNQLRSGENVNASRRSTKQPITQKDDETQARDREEAERILSARGCTAEELKARANRSSGF